MTIEIIAEAAQGYLGDPLPKATLLVRMAAAAQADAAKLQLVIADELCTPDYRHYDLFRALEMDEASWRSIAETASAAGVGLYFDIFGDASLAIAEALPIRGIKIHSTDVANLPLLESIARSGVRRVLLSAGGTFAAELRRAVDILRDKDLVLLHGFQGYPTRNEDNMIARIHDLQHLYPGRTIGFADHVPETDPLRLWLSAVAVGAGARVLEKHITTALALREEDHEAALNPDEFRMYVANMRAADAALGAFSTAEDFAMSASETAYRTNMKKQVVAARGLAAGTVLAPEHIVLKRTSATEGVIRDPAKALGRALARPVSRGIAVREEDLA